MTVRLLCSLAVSGAMAVACGVSHAQSTLRVNLNSAGGQANGSSSGHTLSADAAFVAFDSFANNLVSGDSNNASDIFVRDLGNAVTTRVSVAVGGAQANGDSQRPSLSADGRFIAFESDSSNLVAGDTNGTTDVFVWDRLLGQTRRVSVGAGGVQGNSNSAAPSISADGRLVAFYSNASNLVANDSGGIGDLFVHDRLSGETTRVSVASNGAAANSASFPPTISANGRFVAFRSNANNLVAGCCISGVVDVFVHDRITRQTTRVASTGEISSQLWRPSISADGRFVAFQSFASNLVAGDTNATSDVFVHDRSNGQNTRVSLGASGVQAAAGSSNASISADGRFVAFDSNASNLVGSDSNFNADVFVHDRQNAQTERISVSSAGAQANSSSGLPSISADGSVVLFSSFASNLVLDDSNGLGDVFLRDRSVAAPLILAFTQDSGSVAQSCLAGTKRRAFTVSWGAEGVSFCRPLPTPGTNANPAVDDCTAAPIRGSNWWPGTGDLPFFVNAHRISVCPGVSTPLNLHLRCFAENGGFADATLQVPVVPVVCGINTAGASAFGSPQRGWLDSFVLGAQASSTEGNQALTVDVVHQGQFGSASATVNDGAVTLTYVLADGIGLTQVMDSVEIAVGDSGGAAPQIVPVAVPGRVVFENGFE